MAPEMSHVKIIATMVNCLDSGLLIGRTMAKYRSIVITVSVRTEAPMERYARNGSSLQRNTPNPPGNHLTLTNKYATESGTAVMTSRISDAAILTMSMLNVVLSFGWR